jgi:hypothetical protein
MLDSAMDTLTCWGEAESRRTLTARGRRLKPVPGGGLHHGPGQRREPEHVPMTVTHQQRASPAMAIAYERREQITLAQ